MPLLNIDIANLSANVLPPTMLESFAALPVRAQLVGMATFAHAGGDVVVRDAALRALTVLDTPTYIGLSAVRDTLEACNAMSHIPVERCDFLVGAGATSLPQRDGYLLIAKWQRKADERWQLGVTGLDLAQVAH